ncbi:hypothetical protein JMN10_03500 [Capnocytophaga genosp. AHN8471]|uniref:Uncharacterized protein n=1 Tax=Capnocytophaga genosp. AHN8471 TaxID=327574 RepID=A0ABS1YT10_9FLAO|nr:hypothetical protein [Capnocytophaga genosp. AHN8471]MBM0649397.1 hypothetical protein [Capnocytophaga genosp. AHN8471]MBM0661257.1 hypothetical protein [Capnocytophaga genosp. AHN8471]
MKNLFLKTLVLFTFLTNVFMTCSKPEIETATSNKTKVLKHNYIVVNSVDNSPAEVEVSYSVFINGNAENIVKTERKTTPFIIGGEEVKVVYDSLLFVHGTTRRFHQNELKRNYTPRGADYLSIKNLSSVAIEYAVIGNQKLEFLSANEIANSSDIVNKNQIDKTKVVKYLGGANPIYKATPVLYLIKPELAPQTTVYVLKGIYVADGGVSGREAVAVPLKTPNFGEIVANTPFSVAEVLSLYKQEYTYGNTLYPNYDAYMGRDTKDPNDRSILQKNYRIKHYGVVSAGESLENKGEVWFINTPNGISGYNDF